MAKKTKNKKVKDQIRNWPRRGWFHSISLKVASARHLNRMTQARAFWKAKRMHFWVHTRTAAVGSVHKPKKSDKDSPWVARGLPNTRSPDFYITCQKSDIGPCSFFSGVLMSYCPLRLEASQGGFLVRAQGGVLRKFWRAHSNRLGELITMDLSKGLWNEIYLFISWVKDEKSTPGINK